MSRKNEKNFLSNECVPDQGPFGARCGLLQSGKRQTGTRTEKLSKRFHPSISICMGWQHISPRKALLFHLS